MQPVDLDHCLLCGVVLTRYRNDFCSKECRHFKPRKIPDEHDYVRLVARKTWQKNGLNDVRVGMLLDEVHNFVKYRWNDGYQGITVTVSINNFIEDPRPKA